MESSSVNIKYKKRLYQYTIKKEKCKIIFYEFVDRRNPACIKGTGVIRFERKI